MMKTSTTRKLRAYSLLAHGKVDKISDFAYRVWSQTEEGKHYIVVREGLEWKCECPDFAFNHLSAVGMYPSAGPLSSEQLGSYPDRYETPCRPPRPAPAPGHHRLWAGVGPPLRFAIGLSRSTGSVLGSGWRLCP